jgi:hypothetical protein
MDQLKTRITSQRVWEATIATGFLVACLAHAAAAQSQPVPVNGTFLPSTSGATASGVTGPSLPNGSGFGSNPTTTSAPPALSPSPNPSVSAPNPQAAPAITNGSSSPSMALLEGEKARSTNNTPKQVGRMELPTANGQHWVEYDIRSYTQNQKNVERPQQAIIDWIIRETGSDVWFNEPMGILNADRNTLRVYHNAAMQKTVAQIYERFVNGVVEPQVFSLRLITVANPNWRNRTTNLMRSAPAQTPGVQAWLMTKENGAMFMSQLRQRSDAREMQAVDIAMVNGQSQSLEQLRSRNYLREYQSNTTSIWPPYTPVSDEIKEGYKINVSPLMSLDGRSVDMMLKCEIDQVERLNNVSVDLPIAGGPSQTVQIDVPQLVSWRLHERFQWPADKILMLSCGVVAAPSGQVNNTLLSGNPPALFGLNKILPTSAGQRTDALLLIEHKGPASTQLHMPLANSASTTGPSASPPNNVPINANAPISRGRY